MGIIKRKKEQESQPSSKDFATAYSAHKASKGTKSFAKATSAAMPDAPSSIADAIMKQRKMAEGGMVDDDNMETPARTSPYEDDDMEATMKELYDDGDDQIGPEPMGSEGGPDEDDHDMDMVSKIRRRMKG